MKILMIAPRPFYTDKGFSVQILEGIKALKQKGNEILICCYPLGDDIAGIKISRPIRIPWYRDPLKKATFDYVYLDILLFFSALKSALRFKPDIIHAHIHEGGLIGIIIGRLLGVPVILDIQGSMLGEYRERGLSGNKLIEKAVFFIERLVNRNADAIITELDFHRDNILKDPRIHKSRVHRIIYGVDTELFSSRPRDTNLKEELGIPEQRKVIGYLGLLTFFQGIDYLLDAMKLIVNKRSDAHLLLMGFQDIKKYKKKAQDLGLRDYVTFTGRVPYNDAPRFLSLCDIAVGPKISFAEGNGKLINYMSVGLPTVAFDIPMNKELLGEFGVYAKLKDTQDLAGCILHLMESSNERIRLSNKLRERAVEKFSLEKFADYLMGVYKVALARCIRA